MKIDELLDRSCAWLTEHDASEIAISSRIRLARNVDGYPFPGKASEKERDELCHQVMQAARESRLFWGGWSGELRDLNAIQRAALCERNLISADHLENLGGSAAGVSKNEQLAVMINEEDHIRLQVMEPGFGLRKALKTIEKWDNKLEDKINYAFHDRYGYLTSCPSNTGTGMRAGVMLHLPGLALLDEIGPVIKGLSKLGCAVRGIGGEGSEADGFFYQVSNQVTLGVSEEEIIAKLENTVNELIEHEKNARIRLMQEKRNWVYDRVGRAFGIITNACIITSKEAIDFLGMLRLGLALGLLELENQQHIEALLLEVRPAHLQRYAGRDLDAAERDQFRAMHLRSRLADLKKADRLGPYE